MTDSITKPTLLIIGLSSFVGSNLAKFFSDRYRIVGTYFNHSVSIAGVTAIHCDISKKESLQKIVAWFRPSIVIYCAGESSISYCQKKPKVSELRNSTGVVNALLASERVHAKFIYLSSSYVLNGGSTLSREADVPIPETVFGHHVSASEFYVQRSSLNYLVIRSCPLYGLGYTDKMTNIFERVIHSVKKEENLEVDATVKTGFLDVFFFAEILNKILESKITNRLIQVSSSDVTSYFEFSMKLASKFHLNEKYLLKSSNEFFQELNSKKLNQVPLIFQMDLSNLIEITGLKIPSIEDSLNYTLKRFKLSEKSV